MLEYYAMFSPCVAFFSDKDVAALMDEFLRMKDFDHHNVLTILGVCVDAGAAPYIVMPYMSNGSLLEFVRDNRDTFVITDPLDTNVCPDYSSSEFIVAYCISLTAYFHDYKDDQYLPANKQRNGILGRQ